MSKARLKALLESAYADFHSHRYREQDPISVVHTYADPRDREIVAFLTALLSYGNVTTILGSVRKVMSALAPSPHAALLRGDFPAELRSFRHRFTTGADLEILFHWLATAVRSEGSLEAFFVGGRSNPREIPMRELLSDFIRRFTSQALPTPLDRLSESRVRNVKYLLSDPERGSACKRLNMFLRWVVRSQDGVDLGLWGRLHPSQLVLPIDTHLLQTLRALRWTRSKHATWKVAEAATERLRRFDPEDPTRYDFALCHLSMEGNDIRDYCRRTDATME